jgi:hypothetical protein
MYTALFLDRFPCSSFLKLKLASTHGSACLIGAFTLLKKGKARSYLHLFRAFTLLMEEGKEPALAAGEKQAD